MGSTNDYFWLGAVIEGDPRTRLLCPQNQTFKLRCLVFDGKPED